MQKSIDLSHLSSYQFPPSLFFEFTGKSFTKTIKSVVNRERSNQLLNCFNSSKKWSESSLELKQRMAKISDGLITIAERITNAQKLVELNGPQKAKCRQKDDLERLQKWENNWLSYITEQQQQFLELIKEANQLLIIPNPTH